MENKNYTKLKLLRAKHARVVNEMAFTTCCANRDTKNGDWLMDFAAWFSKLNKEADELEKEMEKLIEEGNFGLTHKAKPEKDTPVRLES